jgi:putative flippase GtrA
MLSFVLRLRDLLRRYDRPLRYSLVTVVGWRLSLYLLHVYVEQLHVSSTKAVFLVPLTTGPLAFIVNRNFTFNDRRPSWWSCGSRGVIHKILISVPPYAAYLLLVRRGGLPYMEVKLYISIAWGGCIVFPLNYLIFNRWVYNPHAPRREVIFQKVRAKANLAWSLAFSRA